MKDFIYNIRRFFLHSRRRHRPGLDNFGLNFRKDPVFRVKIILISLVIILVLLFVLSITVFPENKIKTWISGGDITEVDLSASSSPQDMTPTPEPSLEVSTTPSSTPDPDEATPTPLETQEEKTTTTGWITAESGLVVRTGPSTQNTKLGTLPFGAQVEIISEDGFWYFIEYQGGGGYIHSNYVVIGDSPPGSSAKNTNTSMTWTHLTNSTSILVEKIFYNGATYYIADVKTDPKNISSIFSEQKLKPSELLNDQDYIMAISGDDYLSQSDGVIIKNGEIVRSETYDTIAVLYDDGRLVIYYDNEKSSAELINDGAWQSWVYGPVLVEDFRVNDNIDLGSSLAGLNPRTGIGMVEPGHYILIVVDGRQESSKGLTIDEFAELFKEYECETAYNLPGGSISLMFFEGDLISSPSSGIEQPVSDLIIIK